MRSSSRVVIAALLVVLLPDPVRGDDLSCLTKTKGQLVKWDRDWQGDLGDHDVTYSVDSVTERNVRNEPSGYVIRLTAKGPARKRERTATIIKELAARFFCGRIVSTASDGGIKLGMPQPARNVAAVPEARDVASVYPSEEPSPAKLSYRRWIKNSWVPAAVPVNEDLFVCRVPGGPIACNRTDFDLLNRDRTLSQLPKSTVLVKLPGNFIRYSQEAGWTKEEPIGPLADASIAECPIAGRTYYCLSEEKGRFKGYLQELEREIAVQRSLAAPRAAAEKKKAKK